MKVLEISLPVKSDAEFIEIVFNEEDMDEPILMGAVPPLMAQPAVIKEDENLGMAMRVDWQCQFSLNRFNHIGSSSKVNNSEMMGGCSTQIHKFEINHLINRDTIIFRQFLIGQKYPIAEVTVLIDQVSSDEEE